MHEDYYKRLGVARNATQQEIKQAYHKMAMRHHPDNNAGDPQATERFKDIAEAYEILKDEKKRAVYDRLGKEGLKGNHTSASGGFDFHDFAESFGMHFGNRSTQQQGADLLIKLTVTLQEVAQGVNRKVKIKRYAACDACRGNGAQSGTALETCRDCKGSGFMQHERRSFIEVIFRSVCRRCQGQGKIIQKSCTGCAGEGRKMVEEMVPINLPPGVQHEMQFAMAGKGHAARQGGKTGTLYVEVIEVNHSHLQRKGIHVHHRCHVSFTGAVLGTQIQIPTVSGHIKLTIPPYTQNGSVLRLKRQGLPELHGSRVGDQLVHVHVWVPRKLSRETLKTLEQLDQTKTFDP